MAILAFVCMKYPDTELNIIFLPGFGFSADTVYIFTILNNLNFYLKTKILGNKMFNWIRYHWMCTTVEIL